VGASAVESQKSLGLLGYHSAQFYVHNLKEVVDWHVEKLDFKVVAKSTSESEKRLGMTSVALKVNETLSLVFTQPIEAASSAGKYLAVHPNGIGFLNFRVKNIENALVFLADKKAPILYDAQTHKDKTGFWSETGIATAIGDVNFRFIETSNFGGYAPGFEWVADWNTTPGSKFNFSEIDHVTINTRALNGVTEFYKSTLGFEPYWGIDFHTAQHAPDAGTGSGLESLVMWDPESGIKFANNQPLAPYFNNSQITIYCEDNRGAGVQHLALSCPQIIPVVDGLRAHKCEFLDAPSKYYRQLPKRIAENNIGKVLEPMDEVERLGILVDGRDNKYLLQLFMKEMCVQTNSSKNGPFFYEIIQRAGDKGFGDGNFKALFDSIEQGQIAQSRQEMRDRMDTFS
jgi:4-hydroxyphenylpyruvate dioxygenase